MKKLNHYTLKQLQTLDFALWILLLLEFLLIVYIYHTARQFLILPIIGLIFTLGSIRNTNKLGLKKQKEK